MGDVTFTVKFARLYDLVIQKHVTVAMVLKQGFKSIKYRRTLLGESLLLWQQLDHDCSKVKLSNVCDKLVWRLTPSGVFFSVKSFYNSLRNQSFCFPFRFIWGVRLPLRVKIFLWLVLKGRILTKDNLLHQGWSGDKACVFCGMDENINHLFLVCPLSKFIWNIVGCAFNLSCPPIDIQ